MFSAFSIIFFQITNFKMYSKPYSTTRSMRASKKSQEDPTVLNNLFDTVIDAFEGTDSEVNEDEQELRPPFTYKELIRIALIQPKGVADMSEEEIISKLDDLFPYYQNMKEFDNLRKFYLDKINSVLEQSFKKVSKNKTLHCCGQH